VFTIMNPPVEILVLGCGPRISHQLQPELKEFLKVNGIVVEYLDSANACATFNVLNAEDRPIAAAILPCDPDALFTTEQVPDNAPTSQLE
jgi:NADH dehydrogenase [ubiquinone] 1 alpha subcomplex assembly factor 3